MKKKTSASFTASSVDWNGDYFWSSNIAEPQAGVYLGDRIGEMTQSDVKCPYCLRLMKETKSANALRVAIIKEQIAPKKWNVLSTKIPKCMRFLACASCKHVFTLPRAGVKARTKEHAASTSASEAL